MPSSLLSAVLSCFGKFGLPFRDGRANSGRGPEPSTNTSSSSSGGSYENIQWQAGQSTSFSDLPPELVMQIFKETDDFFSVWALCKTSRQNESIFTLNSHKILHDVAFRCPQARDLASAQELATLHQQSLSTHPEIAQNRSERMLSSASAALGALSHYGALVVKHSEQEGHANLLRRQLTPAEQIAFLRAYYRALALATLGQPKVPFKSLARLEMLEYMQMREVTMLFTPVWKWQESIDLGINFPTVWSPENVSRNGFKLPFAPVRLPIGATTIPTVNWEETLLSLSYTEGILLQDPSCRDFHCGEPKAFYYFTVFDGYQNEAERVTRVNLGELIRKMDDHRRIFSDVMDFGDGMYGTT